jgi:hypothetical protein
VCSAALVVRWDHREPMHPDTGDQDWVFTLPYSRRMLLNLTPDRVMRYEVCNRASLPYMRSQGCSKKGGHGGMRCTALVHTAASGSRGQHTGTAVDRDKKACEAKKQPGRTRSG